MLFYEKREVIYEQENQQRQLVNHCKCTQNTLGGRKIDKNDYFDLNLTKDQYQILLDILESRFYSLDQQY